MVKKHLKWNKLIFSIVTCFLCLFLYSCSFGGDKPSNPDAETYYTISFYMDDGYTKFKDVAFKENTKVELTENPIKESTKEATFTFMGWSLELGGAVESEIIADKTKALYAVFAVIPVGKTVVNIPEACEDSFIYTGDVLKYSLQESEHYNIGGLYQTEAGNYKVIVSLKNPDEMIWEDGTTANKTYEFVINKADNIWVNEPTIGNWKVEDGINSPSGSSKFGEVVFTYSDTSNGVFTSNVPNAVGEYFMKATVVGNENYSSLSIVVPFSITTNICEIKFYDVDNRLLDSQIVNKGDTVNYLGTSLGKDGSNIVTEFTGWEHEGVCYTQLPVASESRSYYATYETKLKDGKGTLANPYNLTTAEEMVLLAGIVNNGNNCEGKYFTVNNNIDLTNTTFLPIGNKANPFKGSFDFNNYQISYDLTGEVVGLFGNNAGTISNLNVVANANATDVAGGVAAINSGTIINSSVSGNVNANNFVGGIVGNNSGAISCVKSTSIVAKDDKFNAKDLVGSNGIGYLVGKASTNHSLTIADSIWDGSIAAGYAGGTGTATDPYLIATAEQLAFFKDNTNSSTSYYKGKYFKLTADIDLNNILWNGVGTGNSSTGFAGSFDGNGHVIYNVNIDGTNARRGFFNSTSAGSEIKNLVIYGSIESSSNYVAVLSAINYAYISNCYVFGNVVTTGQYAGLLTSWDANAIYEDCVTYGLIEAKDSIGGIAGYHSKDTSGIGNITNCINYASIIATGLSNTSTSGVAGIVGVVGSMGTISNCKNYGTVTTTINSNGGIAGIVGNLFSTLVINCHNYGDITGVNAVGGIVGYGRAGGTISYCENNGVVTGSHNVGGISGENRSNIDNSVNNGTVKVSASGAGHWIGGIAGMSGSSATITACENNGDVVGIGSATGGVGGIVGGLYGALSTCVNNGNVTGKYYLGGIAGSLQNANASVSDSINNGTISTTVTSGTVNLGCIVGYNIGKIIGNTNNGNYVLPADNSCINYSYIVGYDTVGETGVYNNTNNNA